METITAASPSITPPAFLTQTPYDYQLKATAALLKKEANPWTKVGRFESVKLNFSIFVSPVGSGKSLTALMVANHPSMSPMDIPVDMFQMCSNEGSLPLVLNKSDIRCIDATLIVVPKTLISQWRHYIRTNTNITDYLVIETVSQKIIDSIEASGHTSSMVLCSPECSNKFPINWFWRRVIVDEPEVISKKKSWRIPKSAHTLMLTANLEEISAIPKSKGAFGEVFYYIRDMSKTYGMDLIPKMVVKVGQDFYTECTNTPNYHADVHLGPKVKVAEVLKQVMNITDDAVVALNIGDYITASKLLKLGSEFDALEPFLEGVIQNATTKVQKFEEKLEQMSGDVTTPHEEIVKAEQRVQHLKLEYARVTEELTRAIAMDKEGGAGWAFKSAKLGVVLSKMPPTGKAIVFSQYMHAGIKHMLETGVKVMDLTSPMTAAQLSTIMNDIITMKDRVVVMLNPEHYGRGLNMQYVDNIVVMHATTKETLQQWIGRGYRIGRTTNLTVDIILNADEADEIVEEFGGSSCKKQMVDDEEL